VEKLKQLASCGRQEVNVLLPDTAQCMQRILHSAAKGSVKDSVKILFAVEKRKEKKKESSLLRFSSLLL
jgi:hypothetical protein